METGGGDGSEMGLMMKGTQKSTTGIGASLIPDYRDKVESNGNSLTRFNKICHPSQRPRWQVDKEAIGLSRVQQCSSTYSPPS